MNYTRKMIITDGHRKQKSHTNCMQMNCTRKTIITDGHRKQTRHTIKNTETNCTRKTIITDGHRKQISPTTKCADMNIVNDAKKIVELNQTISLTIPVFCVK